MQIMEKKISSLYKIYNKSLSTAAPSLLVFFILILVFLLSVPYLNDSASAAENSYIPAAPSGPEFGFLNVEYEYTVYTTSSDSLWMFDWGDGTTSDWKSLTDSTNSITQSRSWNSVGNYQVRVKFKNDFFVDGVWSDSLEVTISKYYEEDVPLTPTTPSGKIVGCTDVECSYSTYTTDLKGDLVQYRFDWGDESISDWTSLTSSDSLSSVSHSWKKIGEYSVRSQARDQYGLISSWSEALPVTIEPDSDGDTLSDTIEKQLGSNAHDPTDVTIVTINGMNQYIIHVNQTVIFYNSTSGNASILNSNSEGNYLIDDNKDARWDYIYDPISGSFGTYEEQPSDNGFSFVVPWQILVILGIIVGIILTVFILIKTGVIYLYDEYVVEE